MRTDQLTAPGAWWDARLTRLGFRRPVARDALLAVTVAVVMAAAVLTAMRYAPADLAPAEGTVTWFVAIVVVQSLALALRRVRLGWCAVLVIATQVGLVALDPEVSVRGIAGIVVAVTLGTMFPAGRALRMAAAATGAESAAVAAVALARGAGIGVTVEHVLSTVAVWIPSVLLGVYLATRRDHLRLVQERADRLERDRDARVRSAVTEERARLARELHDVAAHHLSAMVVQAAAVERLVDRDPDAARTGAVWLRNQGRETLDNLRQMVGLLREDPEDTEDAGDSAHAGEAGGRDGLAPVPGVAALDHLARTARALGDRVTVEHVGDPNPLPTLVDVSVFRVAQQAVTNARQHARGTDVTIRVIHEVDGVVLEVHNGPARTPAEPERATRGGAGLAVMRERADLVGGTLEAGATDDGGWRVWLRVPLATDDGRRE
ncbi:histidine kinase-, DNA gyrase B-, and HSP90-like ATPase family protein [Dietzia sp. DQ12-45-1b]|nr:histidine kinase-, DNA gyrase B-, and HSP90-like ATPase family protein [Dietzia sp. DQ12-45-1b]